MPIPTLNLSASHHRTSIVMAYFHVSLILVSSKHALSLSTISDL
jgi:hypothetical protein